jgi:enoyl-CoA hydratase/carnithine racemase
MGKLFFMFGVDCLVVTSCCRIAEIKINRPAKRNAISISMMQELISHGKQIEEEKDVRCVVMSGEGDCFSSGIDLTSFEDSQSLAKAFAHENNNSANLVQQTALIWFVKRFACSRSYMCD